ncbi:phosphoenolpyruvate carboxykinase (ATP) [Entomortierella parvispora]|uniref:Phosphoenolpyruvate carboxykinase (ATP) n=1 Tax=Entomortierella parvispora TaxID=205924 RepID=A0A9P3LTD7_9FUNG|nr:phosphoenolpyruvate carboxykinase (ATP) [Entomortierella parvispora]
MLVEKIEQHKSDVWLINTGWNGGAHGSANRSRISLKYSRAIIDAIYAGELKDESQVEFVRDPVFGLAIPTRAHVKNVPVRVLNPKQAWGQETEAFHAMVNKLASLFKASFEKFKSEASEEVLLAGPKV